MARQLKKEEKDHTILKIKSDKGELLMLPNDINKRFAQFYQNLYTSKTSTGSNKIINFLDNCNLPTLNPLGQEKLGPQVSIKEIEETINSLKNGKILGPDGFSNEFYKRFHKVISPRLHKLYTYAFKEQTLPETIVESTITLIP